MTPFLTAIGIVLVLEGAPYAFAPARLKRLAEKMHAMPDDTLRAGGLAAVAAGVFVVWLARAGS